MKYLLHTKDHNVEIQLKKSMTKNPIWKSHDEILK